MKLYKLLLILLLPTSGNSYAQQIVDIQNKSTYRLSAIHSGDIEPNNIYYKDVNNILDKYVGEWVFDNGEDYVKIEIDILENIRLDEGLRSLAIVQFNDFLRVKIQYINEGVEIYNNLNSQEYNMFLSTVESLNEVSFLYKEPPLNGSCGRPSNASLNITYTPSVSPFGNPTLQWEREYFRITHRLSCQDGSEPDTSPYRLPEVMTFSRM